MPRRTSVRTVTASPQAPPQLDTPYDSNIHQLRRHWKWAAFSQFFFTFSPLLAMPDVSLTDVENDLVHSTNRVLSRIMQRLLTTLTQDRKISADTWQNALRRQYQRRDPDASPIGLLTRFQYSIVESSRASTVPSGPFSEVPLDDADPENESPEQDRSAAASPRNVAAVQGLPEDDPATKVEEEDNSSEMLEAPEKQPDWLDLSMLAKLESLHTLAEWQFQNSNRLRQQMKTDDEQAEWRIEPIGYDGKRNAYWFIGGERLWIQREPPRPNLKRKRKPGVNSRNTAKKQSQSKVKRQRTDSNSGTVGQSSRARLTRGKAQSQPFPSPREVRAAKTRANQKLDAQARDIAAFQRQLASSRTRAPSMSPRKPTGIRVSARLRGTAVEDEWQEVPDEWLAMSDTHRRDLVDPPVGSSSTSKKKMKTGLESEGSSISELTALSDGEDDVVGSDVDTEEMNPPLPEKDSDTEIDDQQDGEADLPVMPTLPDDFVEWETICVTLEEWESIAQQFQKATHYAEKALYKVLSQSIVPMVTAELMEANKKRQLEEAVVHRKRSSRIAMRETEKEEERAAIRKRVEEEEKMSRARRLEVRQQREQAERLRRENAREQRRKERELQEQQSAETVQAESKTDPSMDVIQEETSSDLLPPGQSKTLVTLSAAPINGTGSGSRSPFENWELDCEVCGRKGFNQDGGVPLLCCGSCGKWQHIGCHDKQDAMTGHLKRNWDTEEFFCRQCRLINSKSSSSSNLTGYHSFGVNGKSGQASSAQAYYVPPSNHLRNYSNNGYQQDLSPNTRYPCDQSDLRTPVPSSSSPNPYTSQARSGVTFAHYQPQQGGFSTSRPTYSLQDAHPSQNARYTITPQTVSATAITPYPSTVNSQTITHSPAHVHEQWHPPSYPRTTNSYPMNGAPPLVAQGVQPYYNGHAHTSYSHMRGTANPTVLGQYTGLRHVPSYQHSK